MDEKLITGTVSVLLAIIGVAVVALIVSNQANTSSVVTAGGNSFINALKCAISPVTGGGCPSSSSLPIGISTSTISYPDL